MVEMKCSQSAQDDPNCCCHLRVQLKQLRRAVSGRRLTHPGLDGLPTDLTIHPQWRRRDEMVVNVASSPGDPINPTSWSRVRGSGPTRPHDEGASDG